LRALRVDVERYLELKKIQDEYGASWQRFGKAFYPENKHIAMYITDRCNQKCLHCAADSMVCRPELAAAQWTGIVDDIEGALRDQGRRGVYVWFGGEPTCRPDIRDLIGYCGQRDYYQALITNGVLFTADFAQFCADHGMGHVFVSFDSADPLKNDQIRGYSSSLAHAEAAVTNALRAGLFVCASITVMKQNIDELEALEAMAQKWGAVPYFRAVVKQRRAAANWDSIGLSQEEYRKLYAFKYNHTIQEIRNGGAGTLPIYSIFEMTPFMDCPASDRELTALEWGVGCQACRAFNGVDVNGDVFPCGYPSQLVLGNLLKDRFADIMESQLYKDIRDKKRTGPCGSCHHLALCGGGCRVHAECDTGDYFASFPFCWHEDNHTHRPAQIGHAEEELHALP
jgi:radical SAM protein with 4Fe4S-binding SPASM domain